MDGFLLVDCHKEVLKFEFIVFIGIDIHSIKVTLRRGNRLTIAQP